MSVTRVQSKAARSTAEASGGRYSVTLDSAPTEGQLIVVTLTNRRDGDADSVTISGFTKIYERIVSPDNSSYRRSIAQFYKVAGASEATTITSSDWFDTRNDGLILAEVFDGGSAWALETSVTNDNGQVSTTISSFASGTTGSLSAVEKLLIGHLSSRDPTTYGNLSFNTLGSVLQFGGAGGLNVAAANAFAEDDTSGTKSFTASFDSVAQTGTTAGLTVFTYTAQTRKITITDLKAPNDANEQVANATGVQVKLWIDKTDTGAPDVLVTDATITGGTMEVTFNSSATVGDPVLGVAKWTVSTDDYFFPIETTVQEDV